MSEEQINANVESTEPTTAGETIGQKYQRLLLLHPRLKLIMAPKFQQVMQGSYPIYQQPIFCPFIKEDGGALFAVALITLTKAEWTIEDPVLRTANYNLKKQEAIGQLLGWVENMVVPMKVGGEDQVRVREWGEPQGDQGPEQKPEKPLITLTDQE